MANRITQKDVARALGFHHTTISLALRGHPSIPAHTREKVRETAERLGYRPDPVLDALIAYRIQGRERKFQGVIAWLDLWKEPGVFEQGGLQPYYRTAVERCTQLGYHLDIFKVGQGGMSGQRLSSVLRERGIRGIVVPPLPGGRVHLRLDWSSFAAVALSRGLIKPALPMFIADHFTNMRVALRHLKSLRKTRPGLIILADEHRRTDHLRMAAFLRSQHDMPTESPVPVLELERMDTSLVLAWLGQHRPDAVLVRDVALMTRVLEQGGYPEAERPLLVGMGADEHTPGPKVMDDVATQVTLAINFLVGLIQRDEMGLPEVAPTMTVPGKWCPAGGAEAISVGTLSDE